MPLSSYFQSKTVNIATNIYLELKPKNQNSMEVIIIEMKGVDRTHTGVK